MPVKMQLVNKCNYLADAFIQSDLQMRTLVRIGIY